MDNSINFNYINTICNANDHTMEEALHQYIKGKVHPLIMSFAGKKIIVRGKYERTISSINTNEKTDKLFNWKRPTAEISQDKQTLFLNCFPGQDYLYHYASILSSYLNLHAIKNIKVSVEPLAANACANELLKTNLTEIPKCDTVILGIVEKLHSFTKYNPWQGADDFCWSETSAHRKKIILLGCKFSFWGDIAGNLVSLLASKKIKTVIYTGKLGGLQPNMQPNLMLATGNNSILLGKEVSWNNIFSNSLDTSTMNSGAHYTLPSVLYEDKSWFNGVGRKYAFVDPEIGWMAHAAKTSDINFSYIHIISDNLAKVRKENLSNERNKNILQKRRLSTQKILNIIRTNVDLM